MKTVFFLYLSFFLCTVTLAQEKILSYTSEITIENDGQLLVEETITVNAEGNQIKRGIYRSFPTDYKNTMGTRFRVDFEVLEVLKNGKKEPFFTENKNNGVYVYIGDKNTLLEKGTYTYTLRYTTNRQIGFFDTFDELYFNAIGGDWAFPIEKASITVHLPGNAPAEDIAAYSGSSKNKDCACTISSEENRVVIETTKPLAPKEQLTFAVSWPKGYVEEPTTKEKTVLFFKDNAHVLLAIIGFLVVFTLYFRAWKKVGIDPKKGTIIPLFAPPEDLSPAEMSYLHKMYTTQRTFSAAIVNMAVKGHLKIQQEKSNYTLLHTNEDQSLLTPEEKAVSHIVFSKGKTISLNNKNHDIFTKAKTKLQGLLKKQMRPKYFKLNYKHLKAGGFTSLAVVFLTFVFAPSPAVPLVLFFLFAVLFMVFLYLIKAPTVKGRALMDKVEGFKLYLSVAEEKQLNALHEPDITIDRYEKYLPYAIALGVENDWGNKLQRSIVKSSQAQESDSYSPAWYIGVGAVAFSPKQFSTDFGKGFSSAIAAASTPPGSTSGSGGGGFSGGGGGGGGGGGW